MDDSRWVSGPMGSWYIRDERGQLHPARAYATQLRLDGKEIPVRPKEAQGFRLFTQLQVELFLAAERGEFRGLTPGEMAKKLGEIMDEAKKRRG